MMTSKTDFQRAGFTLTELLIVVAIIAILVMIMIPNALDAMARAKIGRTKSDLSVLQHSLEIYAVDFNAYPRGSYWQLATNTLDYPTATFGANRGLILLSTPIAYVTNPLIEDPFEPTGAITGSGREFTYKALKYLSYTGRRPSGTVGLTCFPDFDNPAYKTDWWILQGAGPDRKRYYLGGYLGRPRTKPDEQGFRDTIYDPTNGTVSRGSVYRVGGSPKGKGSFAFSMVNK